MRISFPIPPHEPFSPLIRDIFHAEKVNAVALVIRGFPVVRFARIAVEMRECEISAVLCEYIEGRSFLQNAPKHEMEVLDVRLLTDSFPNLLRSSAAAIQV